MAEMIVGGIEGKRIIYCLILLIYIVLGLIYSLSFESWKIASVISLSLIVVPVIIGGIILQPYRGLMIFAFMIPLEGIYPETDGLTIMVAVGAITAFAALMRASIRKIDLSGQLKYLILPVMFVIQLFLSSLFSEDRPWGERLYVMTYLQLLVLIFLPILLLDDLKKAEKVSIAFTIGVFVSSFYGNWEYASGFAERASGLVGNANVLALIVTMSIPLTAYFCWGRSRITSLLFLSWVTLGTVTIIFSFSRSGLIVFGLALVLIFLKQYKLKNHLKLVVSAVTLAGLVLWSAPPDYYERISSLQGSWESQGDTVFRRMEWTEVSIKMGLEHPWLGVGPGNWGNALESRYGTQVDEIALKGATVAHNTYAEILAELGIVGILIFMALIIQILLLFCKSKSVPKNNYQARSKQLFTAWGIAFLCLLIFATKGSLQYFKILWLTCGMVVALNRIFVRSLIPFYTKLR
jgi:O-antigen ligase